MSTARSAKPLPHTTASKRHEPTDEPSVIGTQSVESKDVAPTPTHDPPSMESVSKDQSAPVTNSTETTPTLETPISSTTGTEQPTNRPASKVVMSITLPVEIAEDIRFVAFVRGVTISDYVTSKVVPTLAADVEQTLAARCRRR